MKLQKELEFAVNKVNETIKRNGLEKVREYMANVYAGHEWKNFEVRISCDIVKGSIGSRVICEWYDKYNCTDEHVTTLCISAMKAAGLLPFNPSGVTLENNPRDERAELLEKAEKFNATRDELRALTDDELRDALGTLDDVIISLSSLGFYSDQHEVINKYNDYLEEKQRREWIKRDAPQWIAEAEAVTPETIADKGADELAAMKSETIRRAEWLHSVGRFAEAVRVSRVTGVISDEQTRREKAHAEALENTIKKAATLNPAAVAALTDDELNALHDELRAALSELYEGEDSAAIKIVKAPYTLTREEVARRRNEANTPAALYDVTFSDGETWAGVVFGVAVEDKLIGGFQCGQEYFQTIGEAVAFVRELYPRTPFHVHAIKRAEAVAEKSGARLRTVYARQRVGRRLEVIEYPVTLTPCNEAEKAPATDEKANEGTTPRHDVGEAVESPKTANTANTADGLTAAEVLERVKNCPRPVCLINTPAGLLYEVCTHEHANGVHVWQSLNSAGQTVREGDNTLREIAAIIAGEAAPLESSTEGEAVANTAAPSRYSEGEKLGTQTNGTPSRYSVAEKLGKAAAVVLLSLTIGQGKPAQIYTDNPAAVLSQVEQAGETVTAYTINEL